MQRRINQLLITELLRLPHSDPELDEFQGGQDGESESERDALLEELLKEPAVLELLAASQAEHQAAVLQPTLREGLGGKLSEYGASRTGTAELASNAAILISSKAALGKASFGTLGAGAAVSGAIAHSVAVSNFWLGSTLGAYYYAVFPAKASLQLQVGVTSGLGLVLALVSTFIGIVTDPIQAKLGFHQRRLRRLIASIDQDLRGYSEKSFSLREKYIGKLFDIADVISTAGRIL